MEQTLINDIVELLNKNGYELIGIENVSGMGESYVISYKRIGDNEIKKDLDKKILSLVNKCWSRK